MLGLPINAVLSGRVAAVLPNRPPYGNAVIIETPLEALPEAWLSTFPTLAPTVQPNSSLSCPTEESFSEPFAQAPTTSRSLYLLYAHMNAPSILQPNQSVACGQQVGEVGTTGFSVNTHLHLETRIGPSGAVFSTMAHYDNAATSLEMHNYCTWRVTGLFQMFDPIQLLALQP